MTDLTLFSQTAQNFISALDGDDGYDKNTLKNWLDGDGQAWPLWLESCEKAGVSDPIAAIDDVWGEVKRLRKSMKVRKEIV
jgi:hypothetical protein